MAARVRSSFADGVLLQCAKDIPPEAIEWLFYGWLAIGKLHLLAGAPSSGKTTLALHFVALLSRGGMLPDGSYVRPSHCVVYSAEDGIRDTIIPRLIAAGADMAYVHILPLVDDRGHRFDWVDGRLRLERELDALRNVGLVVIDPIKSAVAGNTNSSRKVRAALEPLAEMINRKRIAVIGITHINKASSKKSLLDRVTGSHEFSAVPRIVWLATKVKGSGTDEANPARGVFARAKTNIGPDDGGYEYTILPDSIRVPGGAWAYTSRIEMNPELIYGDAQTVIDMAEGKVVEARQDKVSEAQDFLRELLFGGRMLAEEVKALAKARSISEATLRRARDEICVRPPRKMRDENDVVRSYWELLPPQEENRLTRRPSRDGRPDDLAGSVQGERDRWPYEERDLAHRHRSERDADARFDGLFDHVSDHADSAAWTRESREQVEQVEQVDAGVDEKSEGSQVRHGAFGSLPLGDLCERMLQSQRSRLLDRGGERSADRGVSCDDSDDDAWVSVEDLSADTDHAGGEII